MARIHFIVNPFRSSIGPRWPYEEKNIASVTQDFDVHISRGRLHAEKLSEAALASGAKLIVCVGGDSTLSEIANAVIRSQAPSTHITYHSGFQEGEIIRSLKEPRPFMDFLRAYLDGNYIEQKMDVGEIEFAGGYGQKIKRIFLNIAGFGFSSSVVEAINLARRSDRKKMKTIRTILSRVLFYRRPSISITRQNGSGHQIPVAEEEEVLTGLVHNGRYGGYGIDLSPESDVFDGKFEFTLVKKAIRYKYLLGIFPLLAGKLSDMTFVERVSIRELQIEPAKEAKRVRVDFDGDCWGYLPAHIKVLPQRLSIVR